MQKRFTITGLIVLFVSGCVSLSPQVNGPIQLFKTCQEWQQIVHVGATKESVKEALGLGKDENNRTEYQAIAAGAEGIEIDRHTLFIKYKNDKVQSYKMLDTTDGVTRPVKCK